MNISVLGDRKTMTDESSHDTSRDMLDLEVTMTIRGHPADLFGLSKVFDGTHYSGVTIIADDPGQTQRVVPAPLKGREGIAKMTGPALFPIVRCKDSYERMAFAANVLSAINMSGLLMDVEFRPIRATGFEAQKKGRFVQSCIFPVRERHSTVTSIGRVPQHGDNLPSYLDLHDSNETVRRVFHIFGWEPSWSTLSLALEEIAGTYSQGKKPKIDLLVKEGLLSSSDKTKFLTAANHNRKLHEGGGRHGGPVQHDQSDLIPLAQGEHIVRTVLWKWVDKLRGF